MKFYTFCRNDVLHYSANNDLLNKAILMSQAFISPLDNDRTCQEIPCTLVLHTHAKCTSIHEELPVTSGHTRSRDTERKTKL